MVQIQIWLFHPPSLSYIFTSRFLTVSDPTSSLNDKISDAFICVSSPPLLCESHVSALIPSAAL